ILRRHSPRRMGERHEAFAVGTDRPTRSLHAKHRTVRLGVWRHDAGLRLHRARRVHRADAANVVLARLAAADAERISRPVPGRVEGGAKAIDDLRPLAGELLMAMWSVVRGPWSVDD